MKYALSKVCTVLVVLLINKLIEFTHAACHTVLSRQYIMFNDYARKAVLFLSDTLSSEKSDPMT